MNRPCKTAFGVILSGAFLLSIGGGCGSSAGGAPSDEAARTALEAALSAWTRGAKPGALSGTNPPVTVHDTPWARGERLASFEILGEQEGAAAEKQFAVRLSLTKPQRTVSVQYHVLGAGPLMVFRDEDFYRNINMENGPSLGRPGGRLR